MLPVHGGEVQLAAKRAGLKPRAFLDASASLVPWTPRLSGGVHRSWRDYPDRSQSLLRQYLSVIHSVGPSLVLPGNGAAELFTWAARDAQSKDPAFCLNQVLPITGVPCAVGLESLVCSGCRSGMRFSRSRFPNRVQDHVDLQFTIPPVSFGLVPVAAFA